MRRHDLPPNTQTISSLVANGCTLAGTCGGCAPARYVRIDGAALVARLGAETTVPAAMARLTCKVCGTRLDAQVATLVAPRGPDRFA